jgi:rhamnogalacturonyl hydrolase YesR
MKNYKSIKLSFLYFLMYLSLESIGQTNNEISVFSIENKIELRATFSTDIKKVYVKIKSDRNNRITKITDISPKNPDPSTVVPSPRPNKEIWYPVVDLRLQNGVKPVVQLNEKPTLWAWNQHFHKTIYPNEQILYLAPHLLEDWENSLYVEPATVKVQDFYFLQEVPLINGQFRYNIEPLSETWSGTVEVSYLQNSKTETRTQKIDFTKKLSVFTKPKTDDLSSKNVKLSLKNALEYIIRSQNHNPASPTYGSLNLFYDIEAQTYRSSHWIWGAGPAIKALLEATKIQDLNLSKNTTELINIADAIGQNGLSLRIMDTKHPVYGVPISRWRRDIILPDFGYQHCVATSDANFLSGWGWLPLYNFTGKKEYLDAAKLLAATTDTLMKKYGLIPQDFYIDENKFSEHTIDESGFGTEGLAELFAVTKDPYYQKMTDRYMKEHIKKLSRADGLWERGWHKKTGVQTSIKMTRGLGWAMEGLLATHRAVPTGEYLTLAKKMADQMLLWQKKEGCWAFIADETIEKAGASEKGTALWSYLLYQTYKASSDKKYLNAARKALTWCINNQYDGPDLQAKGGLVGVNLHSAVGAAFRPWYPVTCAYSAAFFSLALMEELKLGK